MENLVCTVCSANSASMVCNCEDVCLCYDCIGTHMQKPSMRPHIILPINLHSQESNITKALGELNEQAQVLEGHAKQEEQYAQQVRQYMSDLPGKLQLLRDRFIESLNVVEEELYTEANGVLSTMQKNVQEIRELVHGNEYDYNRTEELLLDDQDNISTCLESIMAAIKQNFAIMATQSKINSNVFGGFTFTEEGKAPNVEIQNSGKTACKLSKSWNGEIVVDKRLSAGKTYIKFRIDKAGTPYSVCVGLIWLEAMNTVDFSSYTGNVGKYYWGYSAIRPLSCTPNHQWADFKTSCNIGDIVGILVEYQGEKGKAQFFKNEVPMGLEFTNLPQGLAYHVNLYNKNAAVTIVD